MASALRRRRGTRRKTNNAKLYTLLGGFVLICFGLLIGLIVGFLFYSDEESVSRAKANVGSRLRHRSAQTPDADSKDPDQPNPFMDEPPRHAKKEKIEKRMEQLLHETMDKFHKHKTMEDTNDGSKANFLAHQPKIGTKGKFPYYPKDGLVKENHNFQSFQALGGDRFTEYKWGDSPYIYSEGESDELARSRRYHVKNAMKHAWENYENYAFGNDEIRPKSLETSDTWGGLGITLVDALDTLWLMDMKEEFYRARDWCRDKLSHNKNHAVSVFETTIRSLGGLLSAYDWSHDQVFLDQAKDLGARLFKSFDNPTGIPWGRVNLMTGQVSNLQWLPRKAILAEFGTLQIEFRTLSRWARIPEYKTKSEEIFDILHKLRPDHGLYPYYVQNQKHVEFAGGKLTFGAMADSFYEYMLKIWLQGGKKESLYRSMYDESIQGMFDELLHLSTPSGLIFIADKEVHGQVDTKQDHLACFMGGLLALGAYTDPLGLESERAQRDLKTAKALTYTCYQTYARMKTGISPEYVQFEEGTDFIAGTGGHHYLLRPETVESFFVLYHLTGDPIYREWGWEVFQAIEKYCRVKGGYAGIKNVDSVPPLTEDKMESFFLAETLKYLYLLFDPETPIDLLNKHVFNTEAHPIRTFPEMDKDEF